MPTVLVVDDSVFMREHLSRLLEPEGYAVMMAENGYEAVQMYRDNRPDVVLMDITMPGRDGLDALARICELDTQARVVMLTAINQEQMITRAIDIGAKDYLTKPVAPGRLLASLNRVLR